MKDKNKTKEQLITKLEETHEQIAKLEADLAECKQLEREIRHKSEDLTLINVVTNSINRGDSLTETLNLLSHHTRKLFDSYGTTVYLLSDDKQHLLMQNLNVKRPIIGLIEKIIGGKLPLTTIPLKAAKLYSMILETGNSRVIGDRATIQELMAEHTENAFLRRLIPSIYDVLGIRSVMAVPLVANGITIGLVENSSATKVFGESDMRRLEEIAQSVTLAIRHKQAEETIELQAELLNAEQDSVYLHDFEGNFFTSIKPLTLRMAIPEKNY